jgi:RNA polymerase sigma-70 factor (ECF subfamily)
VLGFLAGGDLIMGAAADSATSPTLIGRLARDPRDATAWGAFAERYGRRVYGWARRWGLQEADALDLTQSVLIDVSRQITGYERRGRGSFRGWLKTIAHRSWCDVLRSRSRDAVRLDGLEAEAVGEDLLRELEAECERELLEAAMDLVRARVEPRTWSAFVRTALDGAGGEEVGKELGMRVGAVYVARSKVQRMLREEVNRLDPSGE